MPAQSASKSRGHSHPLHQGPGSHTIMTDGGSRPERRAPLASADNARTSRTDQLLDRAHFCLLAHCDNRHGTQGRRGFRVEPDGKPHIALGGTYLPMGIETNPSEPVVKGL